MIKTTARSLLPVLCECVIACVVSFIFFFKFYAIDWACDSSKASKFRMLFAIRKRKSRRRKKRQIYRKKFALEKLA